MAGVNRVQSPPGGVDPRAAVDPAASMQAIASPGLQDIAAEVQAKLKKVIAAL